MAKRIQIQKEDDYQYQIIGIASDERIWKVCYEINRSLSLNLKEMSNDIDKQKKDPRPLENQQKLFHSDASEPQEANSLYEDTDTNERVEYVLFKQPARSSIPKEAKVFRYFFLIRSADDWLPDTQLLINKLIKSETIRSAVDITHIKQIKKIIP